MSARLEALITRAWFGNALWIRLLAPLSAIFYLLFWCRRQAFALGLKRRYQSAVPVIVVGNITVGGAGKSPLVAYLVKSFQSMGLRPGIVSRGYGAKSPILDPILLHTDSHPDDVGDEPLMLFHQLGCPVAVCPKRSRAVQLLEDNGCDVIVSDDGLQHLAMDRDLEICVFDGQRLWGNRLMLPAGPLREPLSRVKQCDHVVFNGDVNESLNRAAGVALPTTHRMQLLPGEFCHLSSGERRNALSFAGESLIAYAGIGNPKRFFETIEKLGLKYEARAFPDHHAFTTADFESVDGRTILMTEKDAVKCRELGLENAWYVPVSAVFEEDLALELVAQLRQMGRLPALENDKIRQV